MTGSAAVDSSGTPPREAGVVRSTEEDRWRSAFQTHMDPFALLEVVRDADGTPCDLEYVDVNPAACAYHGLPRDEITGRTMLAFYPGLKASGHLDHYLATATGGPPVIVDDSYYFNEVYGEDRWYDLRAVQCGDGIALTWRDVTDRHRLEQRLAEESHRFQLLLTNLFDVVVYSVDGVVRWVSPAVEALLGYTADDLTGTSTTHLWHPADLPRAVALRNAAVEGRDGLAELRIRHRDGRTLWVEVTASQHTDPTGAVGVVASLRDITDRVQAEQALERREADYRPLAENAEDIVLRGSPDGVFEWLSPSVGTVLGWAPADWVGRPVPDLLHPDDRPKVLAALEATGRGETATYEARFRTADGGARWLAVRARPIFDAEGRLLGRVATARDIEAERAVREEFDTLQVTDPLTGLHNRAWLLDHLHGALDDAQRTGHPLAVLLADIDQFKVINESLGHEVGDDLVRVTAQRMSAAIGPVDAIGRVGGDEFVVVLPGAEDLSDIEHRAAGILAAIAAPITLAGHDVLPSACAGIAVSEGAATASSLIRDADAALYRAKARGRGTWEFADAGLHADAVLRFTVEEELRVALAEQIEVHYQPIVRLSDRSVHAHEALVRWRHPERGLLAPGDFLDVAETSGLMPALHRRIIEIVVADLARGAIDTVSVNVSGSVLAVPTWADDLVGALEGAGVQPSRVAVEVTETAVLPALGSLGPGLRRLREASIGLHLDDFGTGYSSIALLRDLPVTVLKLDASFVRDLTASERAHSLAAGLGGLVERLGLAGIAEGIEDAPVVPILQALGWQYGQGYLFGRPAPLAA